MFYKKTTIHGDKNIRIFFTLCHNNRIMPCHCNYSYQWYLFLFFTDDCETKIRDFFQ